MTCFIANPIACRAYAKCHGWQETLAHFFLKSRRSTSITSVISSSASVGALSTYLKDPSVDSGRDSSNDTNIDLSHLHIPLVPPQVFEISSSPDDPNKEKSVRQLDLSPIIDTKVSRTPRQSSLSNSLLTTTTMSISIDGRDTTPEFLRRNSDESPQNTIESITTPLQSSTTSREDLLAVADDVTSMSSVNEMANLLPTTSITSIKHLCDDEINNEQHRSFGPQFRQILGWTVVLFSSNRSKLICLIALLYNSILLSADLASIILHSSFFHRLSPYRCNQYRRYILFDPILFAFGRWWSLGRTL